MAGQANGKRPSSKQVVDIAAARLARQARQPKRRRKGHTKPPTRGAEHEATEQNRATVAVMTANGMSQEVIADTLGISRTTLHKHYRFQLDLGRQYADVAVETAIARKAVADTTDGGSARMAALYAEHQLGWGKNGHGNGSNGGGGAPLIGQLNGDISVLMQELSIDLGSLNPDQQQGALIMVQALKALRDAGPR